MEMTVDERRVRSLGIGESSSVTAGPVVYVMAREQRVHDNWALIEAYRQAKERSTHLAVLFALGPMFNNGSARHNEWMLASLQEVAQECARLAIPFYIEMGQWSTTIPAFIQEHDAQAVVFDFNPLEPVRSWRDAVAKAVTVPTYEVDARNCIPCWQASPKAEFAAHTFRPKVHRVLNEYLQPYPQLHEQTAAISTVPKIDWDTVRAYRQCDYSEVVPDTYTPGSAAGQHCLDAFLADGLAGYAENRNDPTKPGVSNLSPYLRWGNISAQTVALAVKRAQAPRVDKEAFLEELIVRRELTDNYVYYTAGYDTLQGAHAWAQKTIEEHRDDPREYLYSFEEFRTASTHDELWNAMQTQMVTEGKMHGWCRMYWAKKILEWSASPEEAITTALKLNDHYELDGRDSNGIVGVMWSICGVHDRAWTERPVFGKIRYMNYNGAKRKFPVAEYIERYGPQTASFI